MKFLQFSSSGYQGSKEESGTLHVNGWEDPNDKAFHHLPGTSIHIF